MLRGYILRWQSPRRAEDLPRLVQLQFCSIGEAAFGVPVLPLRADALKTFVELLQRTVTGRGVSNEGPFGSTIDYHVLGSPVFSTWRSSQIPSPG